MAQTGTMLAGKFSGPCDMATLLIGEVQLPITVGFLHYRASEDLFWTAVCADMANSEPLDCCLQAISSRALYGVLAGGQLSVTCAHLLVMLGGIHTGFGGQAQHAGGLPQE